MDSRYIRLSDVIKSMAITFEEFENNIINSMNIYDNNGKCVEYSGHYFTINGMKYIGVRYKNLIASSNIQSFEEIISNDDFNKYIEFLPFTILHIKDCPFVIPLDNGMMIEDIEMYNSVCTPMFMKSYENILIKIDDLTIYLNEYNQSNKCNNSNNNPSHIVNITDLEAQLAEARASNEKLHERIAELEQQLRSVCIEFLEI